MKAFPITSTLDYNNGMDLRDYFAAKAMQGVQANNSDVSLAMTYKDIAVYAYNMADAMMEARK